MAHLYNESAFDPKISKQAAQNWRDCQKQRQAKQKALEQGKYTKVESSARLAKRLNRRIGQVRRSVPAGTEVFSEPLRELIKADGIAEDRIDDILFERVIGETRDFLSAQFFELARLAIRPVGRIVVRMGGGRRGFGTGFMVSPRLMITNHHVLESEDEANRSHIEFDFQRDILGQSKVAQPFDLNPDTFFLTNEALDFSLVAVDPRRQRDMDLAAFGFLPLIGVEGKISIGEPVNIIQHPSGEMKQIVVRKNRLLDLPDHPDTVAHYIADTERGSSGSPVLSDDWEVVALHHSGVPRTNADGDIMNKSGAIWNQRDDPATIDWIANEGIRISRIVRAIKETALSGEAAALRDELLAPPEHRCEDLSPVGPHEGPEPATDHPGSLLPDMPHAVSASDGSVTIRLPLDLTIGVGQLVEPGAVTAGLGEQRLERVDPEPDYENRLGYDPGFLGFSVPLPTLGSKIKKQAALLTGTQDSELKYHHYSVVMNTGRRLAFVSAGNLDTAAPHRRKRMDRDEWYIDPRIPQEVQADNRFYSSNPLDRGHLFRRADGGWGATPALAKTGNDDTFHWTNCSPQHRVFNQSSLATSRNLLLWGNLENHVAKEAHQDNLRISIFNGPVFRRNDPLHRGLGVPREFWKIVVYQSEASGPRAVGFVISQESLLSNLAEEAFDVGEYAVFQTKIRDIEKKTGLDFGNLSKIDPLEKMGTESFFEAKTRPEPLNDLRDIAL